MADERIVRRIVAAAGLDARTLTLRAVRSTWNDVFVVDGELAADDLTVVVKAYRTDEATVVEPHMLERVARETSIPVPRVIDAAASGTDDLPPYLVTEYVPGDAVRDPRALVRDYPDGVLDDVLTEVGRHLATLHESQQFASYGTLGVAGDTVALREPSTTWREWFETAVRTQLDFLRESAFSDLVADAHTWLDAHVGAVPDTPDPVPVHDDFRVQNVLLDPDTAAARVAAIVDWENVISGARAYQLVQTEYLFLSGLDLPADREATLRKALYEGYEDVSTLEAIDPEVRACYRFATIVWVLGSRTLDRGGDDLASSVQHRAAAERLMSQ
jgi:Ser/Thr protein kinase RdoA (MazF antagonist)